MTKKRKRLKRKVKFVLALSVLLIIGLVIVGVLFSKLLSHSNKPKDQVIGNSDVTETIDSGNADNDSLDGADEISEENSDGQLVVVEDPYETIDQDALEATEDIEFLEGYTKNGHFLQIIDGITYVDGLLIANKTYALPSDFKPQDTHVDVTYSDFVLEGLTPETYEAWQKLQAGAANDGKNLYISSGFRSYSYQSGLYNNYVNRDGKQAADTYSARPGHSEHQTGLCFDLNTISSSFGQTPEGIWVNEHCAEYGFIIRYPQGKEDETGYMYESWHLRYVGEDLSKELFNNGDWITMEEYFGLTSRYFD